MKILILSFYYFPDLCAGSFRTVALVKQLQEFAPQLELDVITTLPNRYASFQVGAEQSEVQNGVTIRRIALPSHQSGFVDQAKAYVFFMREVRKLVKEQEYALVYATSSRLMTAMLGAWVAWRKKTTLYLDIRDIFVETLHQILPSRLSFWIKPIFSCIERWTFTKASRINLVSKGFQSYIQARYPQASLCWFSNGIDPEFSSLEHATDEPAEPKEYIKIVYAGNIGEGQGLHVILPALAKRLEAKGVRFKIIGDGGRIEQLKLALQQTGCQQVDVLPPMDRASLIREYQAADILFLHVNHYQAFQCVLPSKLFEYAAVGKPILAGLAGYPAQFVKDEIDNAAIFLPCDVDGAEKALATLIMETRQRKQFIEKYARQHIMDAMVRDILSLVTV